MSSVSPSEPFRTLAVEILKVVSYLVHRDKGDSNQVSVSYSTALFNTGLGAVAVEGMSVDSDHTGHVEVGKPGGLVEHVKR